MKKLVLFAVLLCGCGLSNLNPTRLPLHRKSKGAKNQAPCTSLTLGSKGGGYCECVVDPADPSKFGWLNDDEMLIGDSTYCPPY